MGEMGELARGIQLLSPLGTWGAILIVAAWLGLLYLLCTARIRR